MQGVREPTARRVAAVDHFDELAAMGRTEAGKDSVAARFWQTSRAGAMLRAIGACTALEARAAAAAGADGPEETAATDGDGETGPEEAEIDTEERGARSMAEWPGDAELARRQRAVARTFYAADERTRRAECGDYGAGAMVLEFGPSRRWRREVLHWTRGGDETARSWRCGGLLASGTAWPRGRRQLGPPALRVWVRR